MTDLSAIIPTPAPAPKPVEVVPSQRVRDAVQELAFLFKCGETPAAMAEHLSQPEATLRTRINDLLGEVRRA
jgi:hypothetical protein